LKLQTESAAVLVVVGKISKSSFVAAGQKLEAYWFGASNFAGMLRNAQHDTPKRLGGHSAKQFPRQCTMGGPAGRP
jgi:hypothetical protein